MWRSIEFLDPVLFHHQMESSRIAIVIPARMGSTRFPGKPLTPLAGKPMIQWVVEAARSANLTSAVLVATPDPEILSVCEELNIEAIKTRGDHPSGTDRIAEVAESLDAEIFINVQGDEPLINPSTIQACAHPLISDLSIQMASVYTLCEQAESEDPAVVNVVTDLKDFALYFSRYPIPYPRNQRQGPLKKHVGIYGYRRSILQTFSGWSVSPLEQTESLEQLRFLENGVRIKMTQGTAPGMAVDTPQQALEVDLLLRGRSWNHPEVGS